MEKPPLKIVAKIGQIPNAIRYYRAEVPLGIAPMVGDKNVVSWIDDGGDDTELAMKYTLYSDIVTIWQPKSSDGYAYTDLYANLPPAKEGGQWVFPPLLVLDSDDAVDLVRPTNPSYASFGIRDWDGRVLEPGETVYWENKDGRKIPLWEDRKTRGFRGAIFDIELNKQMVGFHYDAARTAAGVTVTNEWLKGIYEEQGCKNVYVFPNSVVENHYKMPMLQPHDGVRVIWEGGASHIDSWIPIREAFVEVIRENPEVTAVCFGNIFPWMLKELPEERTEIHPWENYSSYRLKRMLVGGDINLCPLVDNPFTRCKSAIRWYEGSMRTIPEVGLAAKAGPYLEIEDGVTGMHYENPQEFKEKLTALIKNVDLRRRLGDAGKKWVLDNRSAYKTVPGLIEFYKELKAQQRHAFESSR